ncbi:MAG: ribbon-helix-helix domain-containing protein [Rhodospirillales bacterium]
MKEAPPAPDDERLRKRSVVIAGHATSISLEDIFWHRLRDLADQRGQSLASLITEIDSRRRVNLSSALRVFVLKSVMADEQHPPDDAL